MLKFQVHSCCMYTNITMVIPLEYIVCLYKPKVWYSNCEITDSQYDPMTVNKALVVQ